MEEYSRAFIDSVVESQPKPKFFLEFFGGTIIEDVELIEVDKIFKKAKVASFVNPEAVSKGREKLSFDNYLFKLPTVKDSMNLTAKDLKQRSMGKSVYEVESKALKAAMILDGINDELRDYVANRWELMAIDGILNGTLTILGKGENRLIDFERNTANTIDLGAGSYWNEGTSTPDTDIEYFMEVLAASSKKLTHMIGHPSAMRPFLQNDTIKAELDNRRIENGMLRFDSMQHINGATYYGTYKDVELWSYYGNYVDENGTAQTAMPTNKVVCLAAENENKMIYGYAGNIAQDMGLMTNGTTISKDAQNYLGAMQLSGDISAPSLNVHAIQTGAPMLTDPNSTMTVQVLA